MSCNINQANQSEVNVWIEQEAIHIKAVDLHGDPIELSEVEARKLANNLITLADSLERISKDQR